MGIGDKLRKAAGLFVELPPEEEMPRTEPGITDTGGASSPEPSAMDDIDQRLARMNQTIQGIQGGGEGIAPADVPAAATGQARTVEQIVRDTEGPNLDEITVSSEELPNVVTPEGTVDFPAIYDKAGLPPAPFTAEQTLEMLSSLPANLPLEVKRQTVQVTIGAMGKSIGATPETIVADASRKLAALAAYVEDLNKHTTDFVAAAEFEIEGLLAQVEEKRKAILAAKEQQANISQVCDRETDRLDDILEFFSLDVGVSKYAPGAEAGISSAVAAGPVTPPPLPHTGS